MTRDKMGNILIDKRVNFIGKYEIIAKIVAMDF